LHAINKFVIYLANCNTFIVNHIAFNKQRKNVCYELETEKQLSEKILKNRSSITNPIYINFYFLALISITISIICHVSINYSGV